MKKVLGLLLISTLLFTGCEKVKDEAVITSQEKIQELGKKFNYIDTNLTRTVEFGRVLDEGGQVDDFDAFLSTEIANNGDFYLIYKNKKLKLEIPNNEKVVMAVENGACDLGEGGQPIILTDAGNIYQVDYNYNNRLTVKDFNNKTSVNLPIVKLNSVKALAFTTTKSDENECSSGVPSFYGEDNAIHRLEIK